MKRRAQISGQMFVYIFSALIMVFVVIFGYSAVQNLSEKQCEAEKVTFKAAIEENINNLFGGGSITGELSMPCSTTEVVLIDVTKNIPIEMFYDYPMLLNNVRDRAGDDVFLFDKGKFEVMNIDGLRLTHPFYRCFDSPTGFVELEFSKQEDGVSIVPTDLSNDCTDYTIPEEIPVQTEAEMREEIFENAYSFYGVADPEADYNKPRNNFTMERRISEGDGVTEVIIAITPDGDTILKDYYHFENIPKDCLYSLSEIGYEFYGGENVEVILDDPLIGWHFTEIGEETEFSYQIDTDIELYCDPNSIQGIGFAEGVETAGGLTGQSADEGIKKTSLYDKVKLLGSRTPSGFDNAKLDGIIYEVTSIREREHVWTKSELPAVKELANDCNKVLNIIEKILDSNKPGRSIYNLFYDYLKRGVRDRLVSLEKDIEKLK